MLTGTYRRHPPGSSHPAKIVERNRPGQVKRLDHGRVGEHHVVRDPAASDREDLERVQQVPAAGPGAYAASAGCPLAVNCLTAQPVPRISNTRRMNRP
jgi:hypothetical protein